MGIFARVFFGLVVVAILYFLTATFLWLTWNYVVPKLQNSIYPHSTTTDVEWTTMCVFVFLIIFLAAPMGSLTMLGAGAWASLGGMMSWSDDSDEQPVTVVREDKYIPIQKEVVYARAPGETVAYSSSPNRGLFRGTIN